MALLLPMHTLYPPLPLDKDETAHDSDDDVLSKELRDNFDTMRAFLRAQRRQEEADDETKRRKEGVVNRDRAEAEQLAVKTALAVESEIARLRNGIAELEALLAHQEGGVPDLEFPSLASVIPDDTEVVAGDDSHEDIDCNSAENTEKGLVHS